MKKEIITTTIILLFLGVALAPSITSIPVTEIRNNPRLDYEPTGPILDKIYEIIVGILFIITKIIVYLYLLFFGPI
jgi:hypothetical protein